MRYTDPLQLISRIDADLLVILVREQFNSMMAKKGNYATRFKSLGVGVKHDHKPISVMLPPETDAYVRALANRSQWLRQAVEEKMERDKQQAGKPLD